MWPVNRNFHKSRNDLFLCLRFQEITRFLVCLTLFWRFQLSTEVTGERAGDSQVTTEDMTGLRAGDFCFSSKVPPTRSRRRPESMVVLDSRLEINRYRRYTGGLLYTDPLKGGRPNKKGNFYWWSSSLIREHHFLWQKRVEKRFSDPSCICKGNLVNDSFQYSFNLGIRPG